MDNETHTNEDPNSGSPIENPGHASYGVFSGSQHFTVAGGTFNTTTNTTNTTNHYNKAPSDYRRIPMGDIDLQRELRLNKHSGVADYQRERRSVRRVYSAKIDRGKSSVTVAMYQGESAEEEWRRDVAKYMAVRHPNIVQVCGTANSGNIHATVFHDDLIPVRQFMELHRHSHISNVYIYAHIDVEFQAVRNYFASTFQYSVSRGEYTFFIRRSTGRICMDLAPGNIWLYGYPYLYQRSDQPEFKLLDTPSLEAAALDSLTLEEYHEICYWQFSVYRNVSFYNPITVNIGAVISCSSGNRLEDFVEMAFLPPTDSGSDIPRWDTADSGVVMENGWNRLSSSDAIAKTYIPLRVRCFNSDYRLSQANHIFKHLGISSNFEDYVLLERVFFFLRILPSSTAVPPDGFLFLCPPKDFQIGPSSFKWAECPAYWSFDPTGAERLSSEEAARLGFHTTRMSTLVAGLSWDTNVYAGICRFHQGKGFDPDGQDVARHLGCPLYELSSEINVPFAHIDDQRSRLASDGDAPTGVTTEEEFENESEPSDTNHADASDTLPSLSDLADALPVSRILELLIYVRLSLILGDVLFWLYDHV